VPSTFGSINQGCTAEILNLTEDDSRADWYFLGDVHGDPNCLTWTFEFLRRQSDFRLCFLGDLFDRGPNESKCLEMFIQLADAHPEKVFWIAGNHDVPYQDRLTTVAPVIKNAAMKGYEEALRTLPVISFFPNGIVATHGGWTQNTFPTPLLPDTHLTADQKQILQTSRLRDLSAGADEKELDDLPSFQPEDLIYPESESSRPAAINLLIRGHDHPTEGYQWNYKHGHPTVLTLMGSTQLGVQFMPHYHRPWTTLAKISNWNRLQILRIESSGTKAKGTFDISLGSTHEKVTLRK
jgi:DNA repair exonuclease SbcCD nuclease subunit